MNARLITIFVDVPKPLSISFAGIVSSIAFGVAQIKTPQVKPTITLPIHITTKFGRKLMRVPMIPIALKYKIVDLLPVLTKSPPNTDPRAIPATAQVLISVTSKSMTALSLPQFY